MSLLGTAFECIVIVSVYTQDAIMRIYGNDVVYINGIQLNSEPNTLHLQVNVSHMKEYLLHARYIFHKHI